MDTPRFVVNVQVAVHRDAEYLFVERSGAEDHAAGLLGFPGGKVESEAGAGSVIEATAIREIEEEVGVEIADPEYVHSTVFETDGGEPCLNVLTHASYVDGEATPREPEEIAAVHWLGPAAATDRDDLPAFTQEYLSLVDAARE